MQIIKKILVLFFLAFSITIFSQNTLFSENFETVQKWKKSGSANGTMTIEKENNESLMKVEALAEKEFQAIIKIPEIQSTTKEVTIEYDFYINEVFHSQVIIGESPNRIKILTENNKNLLRLCGEAIQMADGAKFIDVTPNAWHKMVVTYNPGAKSAKFTIDGKQTKTVDLNMQPDKMFSFKPTAFCVKSINGGVIKIKSIKVTEL